jgi:hypothetical protein
MYSLPNGIRTGPVTNDVVANSRDQPNQRAHSTNAGTVTTTHGRPARIARNVRAGLVPFICEAAQPPSPLTTACSRLPTASAALRLSAAADARAFDVNGTQKVGMRLTRGEGHVV